MTEELQKRKSDQSSDFKKNLQELEKVSTEMIIENESRAIAGNSSDSHAAIDDNIQKSNLALESAKEQVNKAIEEKIAGLSAEDEAMEKQLDQIRQQREKEKEAFAAGKKRSSKKSRDRVEARKRKTGSYSLDEIAEEMNSHKVLKEPIDAAAALEQAAADREPEEPLSAEKADPAETMQAAVAVECESKKAAEMEPATPAEPEDHLEPQPMPEATAEPEPEPELEAEPQKQPEAQLAAVEAKDPQISIKLDETMDRMLGGLRLAKQKSAAFFSTNMDKLSETGKRLGQKSGMTARLTAAKALYCRQEAKAENVMANLVDRVDQKTQRAADGLAAMGQKGHARYVHLAEAAERNKGKLIAGFACTAAAAAAVTLVVGSMSAYEYMYNGKVLGVVKDQDDVYRTIDVIGDKLSTTYNAEIQINKDEDITFRRVLGKNFELDNKDDILNSLTYLKDMKAKGFAIEVNGEKVAILDSKDAANGILDQIKSQYIKQDDSVSYKDIGFSESVGIEPLETKLGNIQKSEDVMRFMLTGSTEQLIHVVQSGETFSEIAHAYGMKVSDLMASNPGVVPEKLQIDQELVLTQDCPVVTVETVETATYNMPIPFEIAYENSSAIYKGDQTVKSQGKNGQRQVVAEIVRRNGVETARTEINSTVLSQPVNQVVLVGTKDKPAYVANGSYIYPARGRLSSGFGGRWGRMHNGIDLACPVGTTVKATDGGTVKFAGYKGSYGNLVIINHGGGRETYYAHNSKLLVKTGQKVYQGQEIAKSGNTGRSTGPHVHFEVHINGTPRNPMNYL